MALVAASALSHAHAQASSKGAKDSADTTQNETLIPSGLVQLPPSSRYYSSYAFVVDKKARLLTVWHQTGTGLEKVVTYPADLGKNQGPKLKRDDHKTPEGMYWLLERLEGANLDFKLYGKRAFTTDYPNFFDRLEGKTGSGIWLHAVPDEVPLTRGSRGCVVVRNDSILDLTQYVRLGRTPILIQDNIDTIHPDQLKKNTAALMQWLETWRSAWEAKQIDAYMANYSNDFRGLKMNKEQWRAYKTKLNETYKQITVRISKPAILADRDRAMIRFLQEYTSDQHADFGEKILFLKKEGESFRIVGETWAEETSQIAREEIEATTRSTTGATTNNPSASCGSGDSTCAVRTSAASAH